MFNEFAFTYILEFTKIHSLKENFVNYTITSQMLINSRLGAF